MPRRNSLEGVLRKILGRRGEIAPFKFRPLGIGAFEIELSPDPRRKSDAGPFLEELISDLEEATGVPHAIWDIRGAVGSEGGLAARIVRLDFLEELRGAMADVGDLVRDRMEEFERIGRSEGDVFKELCFCILTANFSAEGGIRIQGTIGDGFLKLDEGELSRRLGELGHRYPRARARYIVEARRFYGALMRKLELRDAKAIREWLVENVKGIGYKEASHFLRNVGFKDVAIIDRHVLRFLREKGLIGEIPRSLGRERYLELERLLSAIADKLGISAGELDLYIWYRMTGRVLK
jgi:N-glycosylase/DNA lyase